MIREIAERQRKERPSQHAASSEPPPPAKYYRGHDAKREKEPDSAALPGWLFRVL